MEVIMGKSKTGLYLDCPCGAKSPVSEDKHSKWFSHCVNCGRLTFWSNPMLTEKLKYSGKLCPHGPKLNDCKGGKTSFCKLCRTRVFMPTSY